MITKLIFLIGLALGAVIIIRMKNESEDENNGRDEEETDNQTTRG